MHYQEAIDKVESSDTFKNWKNDNPTAYLAHIFVSYANNQLTSWQVGYAVGTMITNFVLSDEVTKEEQSEVLQKTEQTIPQLKKDAYISVEDALNICEQTREEQFGTDISKQTICILQTIDGKALWNMTMATLTLKVINIRIDALTKEVVKSEKLDLFQWNSGEKK